MNLGKGSTIEKKSVCSEVTQQAHSKQAAAVALSYTYHAIKNRKIPGRIRRIGPSSVWTVNGADESNTTRKYKIK